MPKIDATNHMNSIWQSFIPIDCIIMAIQLQIYHLTIIMLLEMLNLSITILNFIHNNWQSNNIILSIPAYLIHIVTIILIMVFEVTINLNWPDW